MIDPAAPVDYCGDSPWEQVMRRFLAASAVFALLGAAALSQENMKELDKFQGAWKVVKLVGDAEKQKGEFRLEFKGTKFNFRIIEDGRVVEQSSGTFKIDPAQKPAT